MKALRFLADFLPILLMQNVERIVRLPLCVDWFGRFGIRRASKHILCCQGTREAGSVQAYFVSTDTKACQQVR